MTPNEPRAVPEGMVARECRYNHPIGTRCPACAKWPYPKGGAAQYQADHAPSPVAEQPATVGGVDRIAVAAVTMLQAIEGHCRNDAGLKGVDHADEGKRIRRGVQQFLADHAIAALTARPSAPAEMADVDLLTLKGIENYYRCGFREARYFLDPSVAKAESTPEEEDAVVRFMADVRADATPAPVEPGIDREALECARDVLNPIRMGYRPIRENVVRCLALCEAALKRPSAAPSEVERLIADIDAEMRDVIEPSKRGKLLLDCRAALAAMTPQARIYVRWSDDGQNIRKWSREPFEHGEPVTCKENPADLSTSPESVKLVTMPPQVPGWRMVPVEPTSVMVEAAREIPCDAQTSGGVLYSTKVEAKAIWAAMLAAAPTPLSEKSE